MFVPLGSSPGELVDCPEDQGRSEQLNGLGQPMVNSETPSWVQRVAQTPSPLFDLQRRGGAQGSCSR